MTELQDYQFELDGVVFGIGADLSVEAEGFEPGVNEFTTQDVVNSFDDSLAFGRDYVTPALWTWAAFTTADDESAALESIRPLAIAWNDRQLRRTPGAVKALRYRIDGRTRVIYGRPRPFGQAMNNKLLHGEIPLNLEFQPADILHYDDEERTFSVSGQATTTPGFSFPASFPLTTFGDVEPANEFISAFGGDEPAPFRVTFQGGTNPRIFTEDWEIGIDATLAEGETVTVSTYPFGPRAVRGDGTPATGLLSMRTRLAGSRLQPEGQTVQYGAIDSDGTATATISWRPVYTTI